MTVLKPPPSTDERRARRRKKAQRAALGCLSLLWVLWVVENLIGEQNAWVAVLTYVPQFPLLIFPVVLLALALARREWRATGLNSVGVVFWLVWGMGCVVPLRWPFGSHQTSARLKVMSFNILGGQWGVERIAQVVQRENPDVICFEETREPGGGDLISQLKVALPGYRVAQALEVDVHFTPLKIGELRQNGVQLYARQIDVGIAAREVQKSLLFSATQYATENPDALLVMGDFNTPPRGRLYRELASRWQDAFRSAGSGLGHTFSSRLPLVRIDYIWTNPMLVVRCCTPLDPVGISSRGKRGMASDHRPLMAELDLLS